MIRNCYNIDPIPNPTVELLYLFTPTSHTSNERTQVQPRIHWCLIIPTPTPKAQTQLAMKSKLYSPPFPDVNSPSNRICLQLLQLPNEPQSVSQSQRAFLSSTIYEHKNGVFTDPVNE